MWLTPVIKAGRCHRACSSSGLSRPWGRAPGEALGFLLPVTARVAQRLDRKPFPVASTVMRSPRETPLGPVFHGPCLPQSGGSPSHAHPAFWVRRGRTGSEGPHSRGLVALGNQQTGHPSPCLASQTQVTSVCPHPFWGAGYVSQWPEPAKVQGQQLGLGASVRLALLSRAGPTSQTLHCDRGPAGLTRRGQGRSEDREATLGTLGG